MITIISGMPGGGKSYEAVKFHVIPALKAGRKVITNLPINVAHVSEKIKDFDPDLLVLVEFDYSDFESGAQNFPFAKPADYEDEWRNDDGVGPLYVIDEAHYSLPRAGTPEPVKKFYFMHRHYGVDIALITQFPRQIDRDILQLVELVHRCIKNTAMGSTTSYTKKVQQGYRGDVVNTSIRRYDPEIFPYYRSHTQSKTAVIEATTRDVTPIWKRWPFVGASLFLTVGFVWVVVLLASGGDAEASQVKPVGDVEVVDKPSAAVRRPSPSYDDHSSHPYSTVELHVTGRSEFSKINGNAVFIEKLTHFIATRDSVGLFTLDHVDLVQAGYSVEVLGDCLVKIEYKGFRDWVICDDPTEPMSHRRTGYEIGVPSSE